MDSGPDLFETNLRKKGHDNPAPVV